MNDLEVYIKMCMKATKIQKSWKPRVGDLVWRGKEYLPIPDACGYLTDVDIFDTQGYKKNGAIWLPNQSQLQEIIGIKDLWDLHTEFEVTVFGGYNEEEGHFNGLIDDYKFTSMEQLWLAFVMKEKYNKAWSGEEWVK